MTKNEINQLINQIDNEKWNTALLGADWILRYEEIDSARECAGLFTIPAGSEPCTITIDNQLSPVRETICILHEVAHMINYLINGLDSGTYDFEGDDFYRSGNLNTILSHHPNIPLTAETENALATAMQRVNDHIHSTIDYGVVHGHSAGWESIYRELLEEAVNSGYITPDDVLDEYIDKKDNDYYILAEVFGLPTRDSINPYDIFELTESIYMNDDIDDDEE